MSTLSSVYIGNFGGDQTQLNQFLEDYETWLGKETWGVSMHTGGGDWENWTGAVRWASNLFSDISQDHQMHWSITLIPSENATMQEAAEGQYNDEYKKAAQYLLDGADPNTNDPIYVRTGWEFNYEWAKSWNSAVGQEEAFVGAYQNFVDSFREVSDRFLFEWTPALGTDASTDIIAAYPGDEYVDIIGMDFYWDAQESWSITNPVEAWEHKLTQPFGLNWLVEFAELHDKPIAISEWGVNSDNAAPFLEAAMQWFEDNNVLYQNYWESDADFAGRLSEGQYPNTADAFKYYFGNGFLEPENQVTPDTLPTPPEELILSESYSKWIAGTKETETIQGTDGNDALNGMSGDDIMIGGLGDDHYVHLYGNKQIIEEENGGIDSAFSWKSFSLHDNVEHLYLLDNNNNINGTGNELDNHLFGSDSNNVLSGNEGNDWITTNEGNDIIKFSRGDGHDVITDFSVEKDQVYLEDFSFYTKDILFQLYAIEDNTVLYLDEDNSITFLNTSMNSLKLSNFYSIYKVLPQSTEAPILSEAYTKWVAGTNATETITGTEGNDALNGLSGDDTMIGGLGDDHYVHLYGDKQIIEEENGGIDSAFTWRSLTLPDNVEHLYLLKNNRDINGTGNELDNHLFGSDSNNVLTGKKGNDWITTKDGNDTIKFAKGDGHDVITDFSVEHDQLHLKNFSLYSEDLLSQLYDAGEDTVLYLDGENSVTFLNTELSSFTLSNFHSVYSESNITAPTPAPEPVPEPTPVPERSYNLMEGTSLQDRIHGTEDADHIYGGDENDRLYGNNGNDMLTGGNGHDILYGGGGSDLFVLSSDDGKYDQIQDFTLFGVEADKLNITDLMNGFDPSVDQIENFLALSVLHEERTDIFISATSDGENWERQAILRGSDFTGTSVEDLLESEQLIVNETFVV